MKALSTLLIACTMLFITKANAGIISTQTLTITQGDISALELSGDNSRLFFVARLGILDPSFNPRFSPETQIAMSTTTISRSSTQSQVANADGSTTTTTTNLRNTSTRSLLDATIDSIVNLDGFQASDLVVSNNSLFLDFTDVSFSDTSALVLNITIDTETISEIINQEVINTPAIAAVPEPSPLLLLGMGLFALVIARRAKA